MDPDEAGAGTVIVYTPVEPDVVTVLAGALKRRHRIASLPDRVPPRLTVVEGRRRREDVAVGWIDGPSVVAGVALPRRVEPILPVAEAYATRITVPASKVRSMTVMYEIAVDLAISGHGVVFDFDDPGIYWEHPASMPNVPTSLEDLRRLGCVELGMSFARPLTAQDAAIYLGVARRCFPAAVPFGYGPDMPFSAELAGDDDHAFAALWGSAERQVRWSGRATVDYGCAIRMSEGADEFRTPTGQPVTGLAGLTLAFSTATPDQAEQLDRVAEFVAALCLDLDPLYAVVRRPPPRERVDETTIDPCWIGLPPHPEDWLVYAGPAYAPHLPAGTPGARRVGDGVLVRRGASPFDDATLAEHPIDWPADLVRGGDGLELELAAHEIPAEVG